MVLRATLLCVLLSVPAQAAVPVDQARAQAKQARESVNGTRAERLAKTRELNALAGRIEALKGETKGRLLPGGELDAALKRSQELSNALTQLSQALAAGEGELETANLALLDALSAELTRLRGDFDRQTDRAQRKDTLAKLRAVRAEREQVRAGLPAAKVPTLDPLKPSDDPEDLLEQADLAKDQEDKVRREMKAVEARLAELREERELDRRVRQFSREESLFDEQDRRLRVRRETLNPKQLDPAVNLGTGFQSDNGAAESKSPTSRVQVGTPYDRASDLFGGAGTTGAMTPQAAGTAAPSPGAPPSEDYGGGGAGGAGGTNSPRGSETTYNVVEGSDARPAVGGQRPVAGGEDEDLDDLELQHRKLKSLADELKARARALEKKAAELR